MAPFTTLAKIKTLFRKLVFRRVQVVSKEDRDLLSITRYFDDDNAVQITKAEYEALPEEIRERECELRYKSFAGLVNSQPLLLRGSECSGCCEITSFPITFNSDSYCELDLSLTFPNPNLPVLKTGAKIPPRERRSVKMAKRFKEEFVRLEGSEEWIKLKRKEKKFQHYENDKKIVQIERNGKKVNIEESKKVWTEELVEEDFPGDLICGMLNPIDNRKFLWWFTASEQFFRFYKIIMHNNQHVCTIKAGLNTRSAVLSGNNKLCTNTYKKKTDLVNAVQKRIHENGSKILALQQSRQEYEPVDINAPQINWAKEVEKDCVLQTIDENIVRMQCMKIALDEKKKKEAADIGKYWRNRQEQMASDYVHLYIGYLMVFIYKESLTKQNVPKNAETWDVPSELFSL